MTLVPRRKSKGIDLATVALQTIGHGKGNRHEFSQMESYSLRVSASDQSFARESRADSVFRRGFFERAGPKNWYYGYFEKGPPSGPGYTPDAFELLDRYVPNVDLNLSKWTLTPPPGESYGGYPWIRPTGSHPAGMGPAPQEEIIWSVLRYRSPVSGLITIAYDLGKGNTTVPRGGDVTGRIFVNGRQTFTRFIANLNSIGVRGSITANVKVGSLIDFAVDPLGIKPLVGADSIYSARTDGTRFTARISANTNLRATAMSALMI